jgi:hypothetical protein
MTVYYKGFTLHFFTFSRRLGVLISDPDLLNGYFIQTFVREAFWDND